MHVDKYNYKRKIRNLTEEERTAIGEKSNEAVSSMYRNEKRNRIADKKEYLTTKMKVNGIEKEF